LAIATTVPCPNFIFLLGSFGTQEDPAIEEGAEEETKPLMEDLTLRPFPRRVYLLSTIFCFQIDKPTS
jgi:hypothetical protein